MKSCVGLAAKVVLVRVLIAPRLCATRACTIMMCSTGVTGLAAHCAQRPKLVQVADTVHDVWVIVCCSAIDRDSGIIAIICIVAMAGRCRCRRRRRQRGGSGPGMGRRRGLIDGSHRLSHRLSHGVRDGCNHSERDDDGL